MRRSISSSALAIAMLVPCVATARADEPLGAGSASASASASSSAPATSSATRDDFAAKLVAEGDYFRAVSVYKELAFFATEPAARARYAYAIGKSYRLAHRFELAIDNYAALIELPGAPPDLVARAHVGIGASYLGLKIPDQARVWLGRGAERGAAPLSALYLGVADVEDERWADARTDFARAATSSPGTPTAKLALDLASRTNGAEGMPHRSAALAAVLSTIVPGAGQAYTGHWFDAMQAFGFVAAFAFVSYVAYRYDDSRGGPYVLTGVSLSLTGILHIANIIGAERTARYFNQRQRDLFVAPIREHALGAEF